MRPLADLSHAEVCDLVVGLGEKKFRADQLFGWVSAYKSKDEMTNVPKSLLQKLEEDGFLFQALSVHSVYKGKDAEKYLLKTHDNQLIECVVMHYKHGNTICVSTQIGCRMGCAFCASGEGGLVRNLSRGEILSQVLLVNRAMTDAGDQNLSKDRKITNIVLMGSGEPLDNYEEVVAFLKLVTDPKGICISPRNISLSTCGLAPKIKQLAKENLPITLSISLHATTDEQRKETMPIAKAYSLAELFEAIFAYQKECGRRVCFEYITTTKNTTEADAKRLASLTKGLLCFVNLIVPNKTKGQKTNFTRQDAYEFGGLLKKYGVNATIRRSLGADIEGACGQLKRRVLGENK